MWYINYMDRLSNRWTNMSRTDTCGAAIAGNTYSAKRDTAPYVVTGISGKTKLEYFAFLPHITPRTF
jgi:hypothetical protein